MSYWKLQNKLLLKMPWTMTNTTSNLKCDRVFREYLTVLYLFYIKINDTCQHDLV